MLFAAFGALEKELRTVGIVFVSYGVHLTMAISGSVSRDVAIDVEGGEAMRAVVSAGAVCCRDYGVATDAGEGFVDFFHGMWLVLNEVVVQSKIFVNLLWCQFLLSWRAVVNVFVRICIFSKSFLF